jgi:hypothetical protein
MSQLDTPCVRYFTLRGFREICFAGFGEDEIISKNKETINNPAITAPINITTPSLLRFPKHVCFHAYIRLVTLAVLTFHMCLWMIGGLKWI